MSKLSLPSMKQNVRHRKSRPLTPLDWNSISSILGRSPESVRDEGTLALAKLRLHCKRNNVTIDELRVYLEVTNARELCFTAVLLQRMGQL